MAIDNRNNMLKYLKILILFCIAYLTGCASLKPTPIGQVDFSVRAQVKQDENIRVTVSVLTNEESRAIFGVNLALRQIQAIWIEIENNDEHPYWLISSSLDPEYFSPEEVAYSSHRFLQKNYNKKLDELFYKHSFDNPITPKSIHSGFVFVNLDEDEKEVDVDLISKQEVKFFDFYFRIQGLKTHTFVEVEQNKANKDSVNLTEQQLRSELAKLACCTTSQDGTEEGDPLNLVIIGDSNHLFPPFVRRGWHSAEDSYLGSIWKTINSFLFGKHYRYSPVSSLYYEGRKQDISLQKARGTIHQRNHLRLWLTDLRYENKEVWIGQISRDIGVRFTLHTPTFTTHKIDPDIDETRTAFLEDMLFSQGLKMIGFVEGVGMSLEIEPRNNLTGDSYYTDGLRAVLEFDERPYNIEDVRFFNWATPSRRTLTKMPVN